MWWEDSEGEKNASEWQSLSACRTVLSAVDIELCFASPEEVHGSTMSELSSAGLVASSPLPSVPPVSLHRRISVESSWREGQLEKVADDGIRRTTATTISARIHCNQCHPIHCRHADSTKRVAIIHAVLRCKEYRGEAPVPLSLLPPAVACVNRCDTRICR